MDEKDNLRRFSKMSSCKSPCTSLKQADWMSAAQWSSWTSLNAAVRAETAFTTNET